MPWIVLVGMMGSGKTTVGRALAERLEVPFEDTDRMLEHKIGRSVRQMFRIFGESTFRDHETALLKSLQPEPGVLATGGGIVIRDENWAELRRLGKSVYLDVPAEVLIDRLERGLRKRPLLDHPDWKDRLSALLDQRAPMYARADVRVPIGDESLDAILDEIVRRVTS